MIVDDIQLNVKERWFKIKGVLRGTFSIRDSAFVSTPAGRDASKTVLLGFEGIADLDGNHSWRVTSV